MGHTIDVFRLVNIEPIFFADSFESLYAYRISFSCHCLLFLISKAKLSKIIESTKFAIVIFLCFPPYGFLTNQS